MSQKVNIPLGEIIFFGAYSVETLEDHSWVWTGPTHNCQLAIPCRYDQVECIEIVLSNGLAPESLGDVTASIEFKRCKPVVVRTGNTITVQLPIGHRALAEDHVDVILNAPVLSEPPVNDARPALGVCIHAVNVYIN